MKVRFVFNAWIESRDQNQPDDNGVNYLMQWLQFLNIRKAQLIIPYTSRSSLVEQSPILQCLLIMFSTLLLMVSNVFQNTNVPIHKRVCVITPPYYLDWFDRSYPNVSLNRDEGPFCLQCMNWIQGPKPTGRQWGQLFDAVVTILKYKKSTIDHSIYIKVFSGGTVSYIAVFTYYVLNTTTNDTVFTELRIFFEEYF